MRSQHPQAFFRAGAGAMESFWSHLRRRLFSLVMKVHPQAGGCGPCPYHMISLERRTSHTPPAAFPVDAVYTWVNGADPAHVAKRKLYQAQQDDIHCNGLEEARFRDNDELRYSLRSLECFAPWLRSIIVITDNQTPSWLNQAHPKLRVVDHREFIPERYLPTFNSHVIEAYLHAIPGLAEHYVYLNDDVFLARPSRKTEFFTSNGLPLVFTDWRTRRLYGYWQAKTPHAHSYLNTLRFLRERGVATASRCILAHGPYAQTRTNAAAGFEFFKELIDAFSGNRFRTTNEVAMYAHALPLWLYPQKRLAPCDERYYYVQMKRRDKEVYYKAILRSQQEYVPPLFFCLNDAGDTNPSPLWRVELQHFLGAYFPRASFFELTESDFNVY